MNQRWRARRDSYRPAGETIRTFEYHVAEIADDTTPKNFILEHHYSATYPAARFRFGLFRREQLVGVAVFSHPVQDSVLTNVFGGVPVLETTELGRFVLLDEVPGNGETWFLARAFAHLRRKGLVGVLSFSDPVARTSADGVTVFPGHIGTIYQAFNGVYLGRGTPRTLRLLPNGRPINPRSLQKIRAGEQGWMYAAEQLMRHGAPQLDALIRGRHDSEEVSTWLRDALKSTTRTLRHQGNHRYAWGLTRSVTRSLVGGKYPKVAA